MAKRTSKYTNMSAGQLAQETRARGLLKPQVYTLSEWADWLEAQDAPAEMEAVEANAEPLAAPDYDAMTRTEAVKRAQDAGMPVAKNTTKAEAVDFLMAAAGITEDQQAAMDAASGAPAQPENE